MSQADTLGKFLLYIPSAGNVSVLLMSKKTVGTTFESDTATQHSLGFGEEVMCL
jgi:hypothetical protein